MKQKNVIWLDGKFVQSEKAQINILSHALHYGSAVFEGIRAYSTPKGPAIFRLQDHIARLLGSASVFDMRVPYSKKVLEGAACKVVALNAFENCYVRPVIFYGEGDMALNPKKASLRVAIGAWPWGGYLDDTKPLSLGVSSYIRFHPKSIVPGAKIGGYYATSILATREAHKHGFSEAILLDHEGYVSEGPGENVFIVKSGKLFTPDSPSILPGITRATVMTIAKDLGIKAYAKKISLKELMDADEVFLTGTATEVAFVGKVNSHRIGEGIPGPVERKIKSTYLDLVHGKLPRYNRWLTPVR